MKHEETTLPRISGVANIDRRRVLQALGITATAAVAAVAMPKTVAAAAQMAAGDGKAFPVSTMNHLSLAVVDYVKSRDWYVDLFGMRIVWDDGKGCALEFGSMTDMNGMYIRPISKPTEKVGVGHFAFGVHDFMAKKDAMKAEMERRGLTNIRPDGEVGWIANDPAGYMLNTWVPVKDNAMFPGAANPCVVAKSDKCKQGYDAGLENLHSLPKPSGKGFKALYYHEVVLNVPEADIAKERDFYKGMYAMKVISDKPDDVVLEFNKNTMAIRKTANPGDKPYCNQYGFTIAAYDSAKVKAELERRGLKPEADGKGWMIHDPDGMKIGIA